MNLNSFGNSPLVPVFNSATQGGNANTAPGGGVPAVNIYGGGGVGRSTVEARIAAGGMAGLAILIAIVYFWTKGSNA